MIVKKNKQAPFVIKTKDEEEELGNTAAKTSKPNPYMMGFPKKSEKSVSVPVEIAASQIGMDAE
jgi:hypothetical protein